MSLSAGSERGFEVSREGIPGRDVVVCRFGPRFRGFAAMGSDRDVVVGALRGVALQLSTDPSRTLAQASVAFRSYLDEFVFRFSRRRMKHVGLLF
jgi:hypothetical protein